MSDTTEPQVESTESADIPATDVETTTESESAAEAIDYTTLTVEDLTAAVTAADEALAPLGIVPGQSDAEFDRALEALEAPVSVTAEDGTVTEVPGSARLAEALALMDARSGAATELAKRTEAEAAAVAAAKERAKGIRPSAAPVALVAPPVSLAASVAQTTRTAPRPASQVTVTGPATAPVPSVAPSRPVVYAKAKLLGPAAGFQMGAELSRQDIAAAIAAAGPNLAAAARSGSADIALLSVTPNYDAARSPEHVGAGISCLMPEPDYSVPACGSAASQFEQAFEVTEGARPEAWRTPGSGRPVPFEYDGTDKVCVGDDCLPMVTEDPKTIYTCLSIKNEDDWGDPEGTADFFRRAEIGYASASNGRAWQFVKAKSTLWTVPSGSNRPVSAVFADILGRTLAYNLDAQREGDYGDLVILASRPLMWALGTDGALRDLQPGNIAAAEADAAAIIRKLAPGASFVPMWDAPTSTGGPFFANAPTGSSGPVWPDGSFAVFRRGSFVRRNLGSLSFGFGSEPRIRGEAGITTNTSTAFMEQKYQHQFHGCGSYWVDLPICANGSWPGPYDAASSCSVVPAP